MAATGTPTPNIGLRIPLGTDPASVDDINYNSNLIDTKLGAVGNDSVQDQLDDLNSKIEKLYVTRQDCNSSESWTANTWSHINGGTLTIPTGFTMADLVSVMPVTTVDGWTRIIVNPRMDGVNQLALSIYSNKDGNTNSIKYKCIWGKNT